MYVDTERRMTGDGHFTISKEFENEVKSAMDAWTKDRSKSRKICLAIKKLREEENTKKIDDFQAPSLELDFLPQINEPLTKDHLRQLNDKDLVRFYKMMHYNMSVIKKWIDTHEERWSKFPEI